MQSMNKGGDVVNNVGGSSNSTTLNIFKGGNNSLANSHLPVSQSG